MYWWRFVTGVEVAIGSAAAIYKVALSNGHCITLKNGSRHDEIRGQGVEFVDQILGVYPGVGQGQGSPPAGVVGAHTLKQLVKRDQADLWLLGKFALLNTDPI